ncbi:protein FAM161B isoform X1 [Anguilla rostrata]|uniref:protein FAM161B isoform X1 n=1 Tax=Anguilla rostrata TaxID=7938 RepID=UPI0030D1D4DF
MSHIMSHRSNNLSPLNGNARTENTAALLPGCTEMKGFPPKDSSDSEEGEAVDRLKKESTMDSLLAFLQQEMESPAETEVLLQHRLQTLKEAHRQQLQKTEHLHQQSLEKRMLHNSLLAEGNERNDRAEGHLDELFSCNNKKNTGIKTCLETPRCNSPRKSHSLSDLRSVKTVPSRASPQPRGSQRPATTSAALATGATVSKPFSMTLRETQRKFQQLQNSKAQDVEMYLESKRKAEEEECQKKFRAAPVPEHVHLSLYHDITEAQEKARKTGVEQRKDFLLSMQKPFSFLEREEKKKKELTEQLHSSAPSPNISKSIEVRRPIPKAVKDPGVSEHLKEKELNRKIRIKMRAQEMLRNSMAPIETKSHREDLEKSSADCTKKRAQGFLEEKPTFKPTTNPKVPDFDRLYRAFQKEALRRAEMKDVTRCQPFKLRTSDLPPRQSQKKSEPSQEQEGKAYLKRSHSFSGITSLSADILPTYITDDARKRCSAIRRSMEEKVSKENESAQWMQVHKIKSQSMKNTVTSRAKAMDPHRSLKEVYQEKLKQHRETDQKRMKEYKRELQEMKTRVKVRPYLFEQVTQKNAKSGAERRYRVRLEQAGLNEHFVKEKGESAGVTPPFTSDNEDPGSEKDAQITNIGTDDSAESCVEEKEV